MTVYRTNEASTEVAEIRDYLLENAPKYAEQIIASFFHQAEQLSNFSKMGHPYRKGELPQVRELLVGAYRITYYVGLNQLDIMTVRYQAQNH